MDSPNYTLLTKIHAALDDDHECITSDLHIYLNEYVTSCVSALNSHYIVLDKQTCERADLTTTRFAAATDLQTTKDGMEKLMEMVTADVKKKFVRALGLVGVEGFSGGEETDMETDSEGEEEDTDVEMETESEESDLEQEGVNGGGWSARH